MPQYSVEEEIEMLVDAGLLTERQAEAYVQRRIEATPGYAVAKEMGIGEPTVSDYVSDAEGKIEEARETLDVLEAIRFQHDDTDQPSPVTSRGEIAEQLIELSYEVGDEEIAENLGNLASKLEAGETDA